jgi:hypothetical protein
MKRLLWVFTLQWHGTLRYIGTERRLWKRRVKSADLTWRSSE